MAEVIEQSAVLKSPLDETHARLGATTIERDGWAVPAAYGDAQREYAAVREGGAGLIDLSSRGRIQVSGTEAVQFLNGLITNDMKTLAVNRWMPAAFPNVQGRLIASVRVIRLKDEALKEKGTGKNACPTFLIDTEAATQAAVLKNIERFTLAGDFRVTDVTQQTAMISVQGSKATELVRAVVGNTAAALEPNEVYATNEVTVIRSSHTGTLGFDLLVNADQATSWWENLQAAGAQPVGYEALVILRIEAGVPRYGVDMDETNVVTETGLDEAVSYTKGCYVGQEIIARIKYRGHVAKKLTGLLFDEGGKAEAGAMIKSTDGKEIGRLTSVAFSPQLRRTIALGYLKYDYLAPGTHVKVIAADEEIGAQVAELPFVRGTAS
ncbi:MAG TPA: aminomethyltransferase family protein [Pyrinomonadaceae bacterium]|jgi:folate-binding protein YgfZ|nr:aminomethyltransferase family protein [Pyrinomonadaceae bacterium]